MQISYYYSRVHDLSLKQTPSQILMNNSFHLPSMLTNLQLYILRYLKLLLFGELLEYVEKLTKQKEIVLQFLPLKLSDDFLFIFG